MYLYTVAQMEQKRSVCTSGLPKISGVKQHSNLIKSEAAAASPTSPRYGRSKPRAGGEPRPADLIVQDLCLRLSWEFA